MEGLALSVAASGLESNSGRTQFASPRGRKSGLTWGRKITPAITALTEDPVTGGALIRIGLP